MGAITGAAMVKGGLALLALATPAGWVYLIGAGIAITAAGAAASMVADGQTKRLAEWGYDPLMEWINSLWK
ncbi:hypothetical protein [Motiliproteus sp. MSK22-1]|uniref:hypothetical protein n=1 Tax=Motiliproteus sp. MSK22-1 TaxID=1897630 RepID=UPI000978606B|nr:hypothetical protein [Motiliproteus sp. MSK22-1]OMH32798.1 hypothetical protein BGP75_14845 [Motiliproteus sp. MSK22-1]